MRCFGKLPAILLQAALCALPCGCAAPWQRLDSIAARGGLEKRIVIGNEFPEVAYERKSARAAPGPLVVFLEGDGLAWSGRTQISADPTPRHPTGLELALATPGKVVYLARPCYQEFTRVPGCSAADWTSDRYSTRTVMSMAAAITSLDPNGASPIWLVGYSGGGTLAVLIAPYVTRLERVITVAGNLDTEAWTRNHGYLPLTGSLNPMSLPPLPARIRQLHLSGARDTNVKPETVQRFAALQHHAVVLSLAEFDHVCCWTQHWAKLWDEIQSQRGRDP